VSQREEYGNSARLLAAMEGYEYVVKYLLNEGANAHHSKYFGCNRTQISRRLCLSKSR
jgi:ankyrin repeat protein